MSIDVYYPKREYQPSNAFDTFLVNGHLFALFYKTIEAEKNLTFSLQEYNVIIFSPIKAKDDLVFKAKNLFLFNTLTSTEGGIQFQLSKNIFMFLEEPLVAHKKCTSSVNKLCLLPVLDGRIDDIKAAFSEAIEKISPKDALFGLNLIADIVIDPLCSNKELVSVEKTISLFNLELETKENDVATGACAASI